MDFENTNEVPQDLSMEERLAFCTRCKNRAFNSKIGTICSISQEKPTFTVHCPDFINDSSVSYEPRRLSASAIEDNVSDSGANPMHLVIGVLALALGLILTFASDHYIFIGLIALGVIRIIAFFASMR